MPVRKFPARVQNFAMPVRKFAAGVRDSPTPLNLSPGPRETSAGWEMPNRRIRREPTTHVAVNPFIASTGLADIH
jgi:hypothetical protein